MTPYLSAEDADYVRNLILNDLEHRETAGDPIPPEAQRVLRRLVNLNQRDSRPDPADTTRWE